MDIPIPRPALLAALAALAYAFATYGMKLASHSPGPTALGFIFTGLVIAVGAEIVLLRHVDLGVVYLAVISLETLIVLCLAAALGEGLAPRQLAGAALVVTGLAVIGT